MGLHCCTWPYLLPQHSHESFLVWGLLLTSLPLVPMPGFASPTPSVVPWIFSFRPTPNFLQIHLTHAAQLLLSSNRHSVDEQAVLEVLVKALTAATGGWMLYGSCQCLVSWVMLVLGRDGMGWDGMH